MRAMLAIAGALYLVAAQDSRPAPPQNPARDPRAAPASATGSIAGRITIEDTNEPIRWATVSINSPQLQLPSSTSTDAEGRYRFEGLPPGTYAVRASKAGFVTMAFGARRYRDPATPIAVGASAITADLRLPRAGAIEGRVFSPLGDPLQDVTLQALRIGYDAAGRRTFAIGRSSRSDDLGRFRIHTIPPGQYIVEASPLSLAQLTEQRVPEVPAALRTYFPGTIRLSDARLVHVSSGRTSSVDFSVMRGVPSTLAATIVDSRGHPPQSASAILRTIGGGQTALLNLPSGRSAFGFSNVQPGEYLLIVTTKAGASEPEFAVRRVSVSTEKVAEPEIQTMPGIALEGAIEIESAANAPLPAGLAIVAHNTGFPGLVGDPNTPFSPARVGPDGRFRFTNLVGPRLFRLPVKAPWAIKAMRLDDRDVSDVAVDFSGSHERTRGAQQDARMLRVVLTDRTGSISGSLPPSNAAGPFDPRTQVVIFGDDEQRWGFESRFTKIADVDREGRFAVHGLLPGRYWAVVVSDIEPGAWGDPDVLRELKPSALAVSVVEGKDTVVALSAGTAR